ncbi:MAG: translation initiation factor IF-2 subunit gamma [archaeon]
MTQPDVSIGLVGHIDHGKTTLTEALSGVWTDTHSEELKKGITIKLGYADTTFYKCKKCDAPVCYSPTKKCEACGGVCDAVRTISFVDAPGHETLMATMLSGAAIMDGAVLVIAANEPCPSPQTKEHLMALDIIGKEKVVIVQNKIDLVTKEQAMENYKQIKAFVKGTVAENSPIIPISAQKRQNIDAVIMAIETHIPTPKRDVKSPPKMLIARSFDINKPGTKPKDLKGGVLGGALIAGELKVGQTIEILPGVKLGEGKWQPVETEIDTLFASGKPQSSVHAGGSIGIGTKLDPAMTRSDNLSGNLLGIKTKLPPLRTELDLKPSLLKKVIGLKDEIDVAPIRTNEPLMLTVGCTITVGVTVKADKNSIKLKLKLPVCAEKGDRVVISRQIEHRWRLVGYGTIL